MNLYKCGHCGREGLPSQWHLRLRNGRGATLITKCANRLRQSSRFQENLVTLTIEEKSIKLAILKHA